MDVKQSVRASELIKSRQGTWGFKKKKQKLIVIINCIRSLGLKIRSQGKVIRSFELHNSLP